MSTLVLLAPMGTWIMHGHLSVKADVFSFGVLILELISGQKNSTFDIGLLCTQVDPQSRPNMLRVVVMLSKKPGTLEEPTRPGYPGMRAGAEKSGTEMRCMNEENSVRVTNLSEDT
ncbi:hypothetical protein CK203_049809 [Vitis vinifera]|uniref:Protein kinase domain-containing protein n=1 Tax=Vitis vinifera TaxID=29760 RepID=A0A438H1Q6_VITVI|nr:hypothetical protein CK203_049809 [Vitis vinifera]